MKAVEVHWFDAHGGGENWDLLDDIPTEPAEIRTVGLLAHRGESSITVVLSHDPRAERFSDYILIPLCNVSRFREL